MGDNLEQGFGEEIHIIPLGHEIDRAVKPFEDHKPDKVYILSVTDTFNEHSQSMVEEQKYFTDSVIQILRSYGIEVETRTVDIFDSLEVAKHVSQIIVGEKEKGNQVFVNMSSGNKLSSGVASITAMAHNVKAYYVVADGYSVTEEEKRKHGISICKQFRIRWIDNLSIQLPQDSKMKVLAEVSQAPSGMKTVDILKFLGEKGEPDFKECVNWQSRSFPRGKRINFLMKLNKGILSKLEKEGYISRRQSGKYNIIEITPKGLFAAHVSGQIPISPKK